MRANSRACTEDTVIGDGIHIEKGTRIAADTFSIHYCKDLWGDDAEEFCPERSPLVAENMLFRWESEEYRDPLQWLSFGVGPRVCLGMRLALLEEKLALAYLLRQFDMVACPASEVPFNPLTSLIGEALMSRSTDNLTRRSYSGPACSSTMLNAERVFTLHSAPMT